MWIITLASLHRWKESLNGSHFFPFASLKRPNKFFLRLFFVRNPDLHRDTLQGAGGPAKPWRGATPLLLASAHRPRQVSKKREPSGSTASPSAFASPQASRLSWSTTAHCTTLNDKQFYIKKNMKTQLIRSHGVDWKRNKWQPTNKDCCSG